MPLKRSIRVSLRTEGCLSGQPRTSSYPASSASCRDGTGDKGTVLAVSGLLDAHAAGIEIIPVPRSGSVSTYRLLLTEGARREVDPTELEAPNSGDSGQVSGPDAGESGAQGVASG